MYSNNNNTARPHHHDTILMKVNNSMNFLQARQVNVNFAHEKSAQDRFM